MTSILTGRPRQGLLYVVGVPIGHPDDLTVRAIAVLKAVSVIACKDPRATQALLEHHGITAQLTSYHRGNGEERTAVLLDRLRAGSSVALVSDLGTPAVYDPGTRLVRSVLRSGMPVVPIPGPSAVTAALSVSGLDGDSFFFAGPLPSGSRSRTTWLMRLARCDQTLIVFAEGSGLAATIRTLRRTLGHRRLVVGRSLTYDDEGIEQTTLDDLLSDVGSWRHARHLVLVIEGLRKPGRRSRTAAQSGGSDAPQSRSSRRRITMR